MWIEIKYYGLKYRSLKVTPLAGVWIEIQERVEAIAAVLSLPLRECGLKSGSLDR